MASNIRYRSAMTKETETQKDIGRKSIGEKLTRNAAIATLLLLTVVALRASGPNGKNVLQVLQDTVESQWDQNVGKLTYVSNTLADSIQVFGRNGSSLQQLISPVSAQAIQAWADETPYMLYENAGNVFAAAPGEVTQIAHDNNSEYIIRLSHSGGLNTLYYGLHECMVEEGDPVNANTLLGVSGNSFAFEVQKNGKSVNCADSLSSREAAR